MKERYVYGFSDDAFGPEQFRSKDTALYVANMVAARERKYKQIEHENVYIGRVGGIWEPEIAGDGIIEMLKEMAEEEVGGAAEGYLSDVPDEDVAKLTKALTESFKKWAAENGYLPTFYTVTDIEEHKL